MASSWEVRWSPFTEDKFLLCGAELALYNVDPLQKGQKHCGQQLSEGCQAILQTSVADFPYTKCLSWAPKTLENLLAFSTSNGHILITSIGRENSTEGVQLVGKELVPRHSRPCTGLDWNHFESNLIAQSLERHRADSAVLIWDLHHKSLLNANEKCISRSLAEVGLGESSSCICWFHASPKSFITGVNNKLLRIYDLRDTARPRTIAYSKGITEVKVDPFNDHRVASCSDTDVCIWDTRSFDKPVVKVYEASHISHLSWSPTRVNLLGCMSNVLPFVMLFDLHHGEEEEAELGYCEVTVRPFAKESNHTVRSYDWHPKKENEFLAASSSGELALVKVFEKIFLSWSSGVSLSIACGRKLMVCNSVLLGKELTVDILPVIKRRAMKGYGMQKETIKNSELVGDPKLGNIWLWLHNVQEKLGESHKPILGLATLFPLERRRGSPLAFVSEECKLSWQVPEGHQLTSFRPIYKSQERSDALDLCGWSSDLSSISNVLLKTLVTTEDHCRAVAIAIFCLNLGWAIETLQEISKKIADEEIVSADAIDFNLVAMAMAGFSGDAKQNLWAEMCQNLCDQIGNPYIRAMFAFLIAEDGDVSVILEDDDLALADRLAVACIYLPDNKLASFIDRLKGKIIAAGDLRGLLLTGLGEEGVELLQQYLDMTSDVQTVAALVIQSYPTTISLKKDPVASVWVESYRELLDHCAL